MDKSLLGEKYSRFFPAGTVLFKQGDEGKEMYVIQSGKVKIVRSVGPREAVLAVLPAGEFFGEMSIVNNSPRSATAIILEDSKLIVLEGRAFEHMVRSNGEIALRMIKKLADRLVQSNNQIEILLHRDPNYRVVQFLRAETQRLGIPSPAGTAIPLTASILGERVGLTKEEVHQVVKRLEQARLITHDEEGNFVIAEVGKLQDFLDFLEMTERFGQE